MGALRTAKFSDNMPVRIWHLDIDPSGYMTPAGCASGKDTPFQWRSRSVSAENLASMDGVASSDFGASVLQSRLRIRGLIQDGDLAGVNALLICVVVALCLIVLAIITCCGFCIRRCWKRRRLGGEWDATGGSGGGGC